MDNSRVLRTLRDQAWERAKGELEALLSTYYDDKEEFDTADGIIRRFIEDFEDNS